MRRWVSEPRIVCVMTEIDEIGVDDLERWIEIAGRVRADRKGGVAEYIDWKRQADMVWLVASRDGEDAGAALAYVGWHSKPGTGHGEVFVLPEQRGVGVGSELYARVAGWVQERGCVVLEFSAVAEDDAESLAWVDRRGFREVGRNSKMVLDLTAIEAPEIDPPAGVEIVTWAERPELAPGLYAGYLRHIRTCREMRRRRSIRTSSGSRTTCKATATGPTRRSSLWSTARSAATPSSRSQGRIPRSPTTT